MKTNKQRPSPLLMVVYFFKCEMPGTDSCSWAEQLAGPLEALSSSSSTVPWPMQALYLC